MLIFHDDQGIITSTVNGSETPFGLTGAFIEIPDGVRLADLFAWRVVDGDLVLHDIAPLRQEAKDRVVAWIEELLGRFTRGTPHQEVLTWATKLEGARWIMRGELTHPSAVALVREAQILGVTAETRAAKVITKGEAYEQIITLVTVLRGQVFNAIDAATTSDELNAALAAGETQAGTHLLTLGIAI